MKIVQMDPSPIQSEIGQRGVPFRTDGIAVRHLAMFQDDFGVVGVVRIDGGGLTVRLAFSRRSSAGEKEDSVLWSRLRLWNRAIIRSPSHAAENRNQTRNVLFSHFACHHLRPIPLTTTSFAPLPEVVDLGPIGSA